jgi:hypothetical protein
MGFDGADQKFGLLDSCNKLLCKDSKRFVRKSPTLVVDTFLEVFPFSKIDQSFKQCETLDNIFSELLHLKFYTSLQGRGNEVVWQGAG